MTSSPTPLTGSSAAPLPVPEWVAAPHPWDVPAAAAGDPTPPTSPAEAPAARPRRGGRAATTVTLALGLVVGAVVGGAMSAHRRARTLDTSAGGPLAGQAPPAPGPGASRLPGSGPAATPGPGSGSGSGTNDPSQLVPRRSSSAQAAAVAARVDAGIVDIDTTAGYTGGAGAGTGMILTATGEILTNNHVIQGSTAITVTAVTTGRRYRATVVGTDPTQDVAVLHLTGASGLTPIPLSSGAPVAVGDAVVAIGNAGGAGGAPSVVSGTVQATGQTITASDPGGTNTETLDGLIQTDAPIEPGDSGGPLVNQAAQVIGMNTAASLSRRSAAGAPQGFAIPIARALAIVRQIDAGQASATVHLGLPGFLGVSIRSSSTTTGATVSGVEPGLAADIAGVEPGDTITALGDQPVDSAATLSRVTKAHKPGERLALAWTDQSGGPHRATVTLGTGPAD